MTTSARYVKERLYQGCTFFTAVEVLQVRAQRDFFFPNEANLNLIFQPSKVLVEDCCQFPPVSDENKTVRLGLKIRIDRCRKG
jgi:hypothetical protein